MPKQTRRKRARSYFVLVAVLVIACVVSINYGYYSRAAWTGSFAVVAACWIVAVRFPVRCGVTTRQGLSCRNTTNGVLFGCSQAGHTWIKLRARFGSHERVRLRTAERAPEFVPRAESLVRSAAVSETRRSSVLFWLAFIGTCSGTISMTTDVIGLFD